MNCQDISRTLDSRDVNALAPAMRRACEVHAMTCPRCGPQWIVHTRLAAIPAPPMPREFVARCEAAADARLGRGNRRPSGRAVVLGVMLVAFAAAAAIPIARLMRAPHAAAVAPGLGIETSDPREASAVAGTSPVDADERRESAEAAVPSETVLLVLNQLTDDAIGREFGQQVYERALQELRLLAGVVVVEAGSVAAVQPSYRMTYTNRAVSGGDFTMGPDGPIASPVKGNEALRLNVLLEFRVEALQRGADGAGIYQDVPLQRVVEPGGTYQSVLKSGAAAFMAAQCVGLQLAGCQTPSDIAIRNIVLEWRLGSKPPDPQLEARLHAMLRDPSAPFLRVMAFDSLVKYGKLRMEAGELRAAADLILLTRDPALRNALIDAALRVGAGSDLVHQAQDLLLTKLPNGDRAAGIGSRQNLVALLATELKDEPTARATLESVAEEDPNFDVRADALRALDAQP